MSDIETKDIKHKSTPRKPQGVRRNASLNKMIHNIERDNPEFIDNSELIFLPTLKDVIRVEYTHKNDKKKK